MPKRKDLKSIFIIGAGPIIIGQGCEFDYSGTQACKALKEEGYRVILLNSNPATIMTDPDVADSTYIEPITTEIIEKIIKKEKPNAMNQFTTTLPKKSSSKKEDTEEVELTTSNKGFFKNFEKLNKFTLKK